MWRVVSPRQAALAALAARFPEIETGAAGDAAPPLFGLADFQADAVRAAERILERRRGVVIADSVGLGKTYVALALVERALRREARVAVITPAALRRDWVRPLCRLARRLDVRRTHGLPLPQRRGGGARLAWLSHARLSRGTHSPERLVPLELVVVDEAHAFRNPGTRRYRALAELCRGARVVLITATPVNNSVFDLYHLLRLFAGDAAFRDAGVPDLAAAFAAARDGRDGGALLPVLRAVMVRRTRPFLREHYAGVRLPGRGGRVLRFPQRAVPVPVRYSLETARTGLFAEIASTLDALALAPLRLGVYGAPDAHATAGAGELLRLLLLKRLESGLPAFRASIERQLRFYDAFLDALRQGRLLAPAEHRRLFRVGNDGDAVQLVLHAVALRPAPPGLEIERLGCDVAADRARLAALARAAADAEAAGDPKLLRLLELLDGELRGEKVVVFTEYRDTARALWRALAGRGRVGLVDGAAAALGRLPATRRQVIERFAPRANRSSEPPPHECVDLLIATDVLAEGLNLHDARVVISYDLPWNPVRLIQRIGRVDRIGSPHQEVLPLHFLPDRELEPWLRLVRRLRGKLAAIGRSVGAEAAVLGGEDARGPALGGVIERLAAGDGSVLEEVERAEAAPFEAVERLRAEYASIVRANGMEAVAAAHGGAVATAVCVSGGEERVLVALDVGGTPLWLVRRGGREIAENDVVAAEILRAALHGAPEAGISDAVVRQAVEAGKAFADERLPHAFAPSPLHPHSAAARAARRLVIALGSVPGGPDAALCRRADAALAALARSRDAGTEAAIKGVLAAASPHHPEALLSALERVLGRGGSATAPDPENPVGPRLIAVLHAVP